MIVGHNVSVFFVFVPSVDESINFQEVVETHVELLNGGVRLVVLSQVHYELV